MAIENHVSFETAKLLKEKGFDWECRNYYNTDGHFYSEYASSNWNNSKGEITLFSAPTYHMAKKWLRIMHNIALKVGGKPLCSYHGEVADSTIRYCLENLATIQAAREESLLSM